MRARQSVTRALVTPSGVTTVDVDVSAAAVDTVPRQLVTPSGVTTVHVERIDQPCPWVPTRPGRHARRRGWRLELVVVAAAMLLGVSTTVLVDVLDALGSIR